MKILKQLALAMGLLAVVTIAGGSTADAAGKRFITIGTGGPTGVYFVSGNEDCKTASDNEHLNWEFVTVPS